MNPNTGVWALILSLVALFILAFLSEVEVASLNDRIEVLEAHRQEVSP